MKSSWSGLIFMMCSRMKLETQGHVKLKKAIKRPRLVSLSLPLAGERGVFSRLGHKNSEFNETKQLTGTEPWRGMTLRDALVWENWVSSGLCGSMHTLTLRIEDQLPLETCAMLSWFELWRKANKKVRGQRASPRPGWAFQRYISVITRKRYTSSVSAWCGTSPWACI